MILRSRFLPIAALSLLLTLFAQCKSTSSPEDSSATNQNTGGDQNGSQDSNSPKMLFYTVMEVNGTHPQDTTKYLIQGIVLKRNANSATLALKYPDRIDTLRMEREPSGTIYWYAADHDSVWQFNPDGVASIIPYKSITFTGDTVSGKVYCRNMGIDSTVLINHYTPSVTLTYDMELDKYLGGRPVPISTTGSACLDNTTLLPIRIEERESKNINGQFVWADRIIWLAQYR